MKEKSVAFVVILKQRKKQISPKLSGGGWHFCGKFRSLLSKLMFTHSTSCWSSSHGVVEM